MHIRRIWDEGEEWRFGFRIVSQKRYRERRDSPSATTSMTFIFAGPTILCFSRTYTHISNVTLEENFKDTL
jgi:hypothetical protein